MTTKWLSGWAAICRSIQSATASAVVGPGDLIQAVEQDQAPAARSWRSHQPPGSLPGPLPTAARMTSGSEIAGLATIDVGPLAQREQDGDPPAAGVPAAEATPDGGRPAAAGRVGEQRALARSGLPDQREDHPRAAVEELVDRVPGRGVPGRQQVARHLLRGPADQRDVDVDVAQFRDMVAAGREILHVDVPE